MSDFLGRVFGFELYRFKLKKNKRAFFLHPNFSFSVPKFSKYLKSSLTLARVKP